MPSYKGIVKAKPYNVAVKYHTKNDRIFINIVGAGEKRGFRMHPNPDRVSIEANNDPEGFFREVAIELGNYYGKTDSFPDREEKFNIWGKRYIFKSLDGGESREAESEE